MSLRVLSLLVLVSACGSPVPAASPAGAETGGSENGGTATATETADTSPCTRWDPNADPLAPPADVAAPPETARRGGDGLRFCILREGTGDARPTREDSVRVHYTGWTTDGEMFDSSRARGEPATFPVSGVIRGWTDSLVHMTVGQIRRVWIPEELAYQGRPGAPAGMLVFDIELIAIE